MKIQEFSKHLDEPREIGKKKDRLSSKEKTMVKKQLGEHLGITTEQAKQILDNMCVECGNLVDENLKILILAFQYKAVTIKLTIKPI